MATPWTTPLSFLYSTHSAKTLFTPIHLYIPELPPGLNFASPLPFSFAIPWAKSFASPKATHGITPLANPWVTPLGTP